MFKYANLKRKRLFAIGNLLFKAYFLYYRGRKDEMYNLIGDELFKMGGVYIKFLQGVILQSWLMQRWRSQHKLDIFESIDAQPLNIKEIVKRNLGDQAKRLKEINPEAFAVGSFGHVYRGKLDNGQDVIVKALSPGISETIKFDLRLLSFFWYFHLRSTKFNKNLNVKLIFEDFKTQTLREIDYIAEANFANSQYKTYEKHQALVIPKTYLDLCTKEIIVQEYIDGISITKLLRLKDKNAKVDLKAYIKKELDSDLLKQLQELGYELLWGTFHHPQVMGDPHPGNVILLKDNKIALIDFGIAASSSKDPSAYLRLIRAYYALSLGKLDPQDVFSASLRFFGRDLYLALAKLSHLVPNDKGENINLNKELAKVVENFFEETFGEKDIKDLANNPKALIMFDRLANKNNRFGFNLKIQDTEMLRALVTWMSLVSLLNLYSETMSVVYKRTIQQVERVYPDLQTFNDPEISHNQAFSIINAWLERIAYRDPGLFKILRSKTRLKKNIMSKSSVIKKDKEDKKRR